MGKKKQRKKHNFKHAKPTTEKPVTSRPAAVAPTRSAKVGVASFEYVGAEVRRIGVIAAGFIFLQLFLWYLFNHTGVGESVYHLIKL